MGPEMLVILFLLFGLFTFGLTIWSVIDIIQKDFKKDNDKILWLIVVLAIGGIGPIIYLAMRKNLLASPDNREYLPPLKEDYRQPQYHSQEYDSDDLV